MADETTSRNRADLAKIAVRHGIAIDEVSPPTLDARIQQLRAILDETNVPFPIDRKRAQVYYDAAVAEQNFEVGSLSSESVDLGKYVNFQDYNAYSFEEHLSWACLIAEQQRTKHRYACKEYLEGEQLFEIGGTTIPDFYCLNARIYQQTGWQLATVNMIIPAELFFTCHSKRFFPVTTFMRPLEQDYLQEPDIGHDVAGHVATFTIPTVAHVMQNHGLARDLIYNARDEQLLNESDEQRRLWINARADELLLYAERIYWFTVEFGLVYQDAQLRGFGAGILSSPGETTFSIDSPMPNRILLDPSNDADLMRLVTTDYLISEFQKTYFVTECFSLLESLTPERIVRAAQLAARLPHFAWRDIIPGDRVLNVGRVMASANEKYYALAANQPLDDCMTRTAIRNLRMMAHGLDATFEGQPLRLKNVFRAEPPTIPVDVRNWFASIDSPDRFLLDLRPLSFE
jgi:phenylalanine-4-hydroxylase